MNFEQQIQQWIAIDDQLKILQEKTKELREKKNTISEKINEHIESKQMQNVSVKIGDGQLKFVKVKETQQLTFKYLETCLSEIINNEEQVSKIIEYVKNNRQSKYVPEIKRIYN
jgi:hypothetical protein